MELRTALVVVVVVYAVSPHTHQPLGFPEARRLIPQAEAEMEDKDEGIGSPDIWEDEGGGSAAGDDRLRQQLDRSAQCA